MLLPMSPVDSLFLRGESREHPMHVGALALFAPQVGADAPCGPPSKSHRRAYGPPPWPPPSARSSRPRPPPPSP
ncbi:hypothetical protein C5613_34805 [Rhodococcus opacus]|uniref:O-acyltransferase WSD1-like N-terminal domain-containing protein n=1 Tax=Rhodococcus opacus TaxID=37919 RepID=A0A2S8IRH4_RHOOP|nr:hypothetical protein C5613_34805 [Rhodococcus opacus]